MAARMLLPALLLLLAAPTAGVASARRNVLYIVVDDLRPDISPYHIAAAPPAYTPNFQRLANTGVVFENAYVQHAVCGPSRNSFLSGRRPDTTKVWNFIDDFRGFCMGSYTRPCLGFGGNSSWSSLPQHFKRHGYVTVGAGKIFQPGAPPNNDERYSWSEPYVYYDIDYCNRSSAQSKYQTDFCDQPIERCVDTALTDVTIQNLRTVAYDAKPFFVSVGWHKPHPPWPIPAEFTQRYPAPRSMPAAVFDTLSPTAPPLAFYSARDLDGAQEFAGSNISILPDKAVPRQLSGQLRRAYYGAVAFCDHNLGRLLDELEALQIDQSTMVIIHGDHGWNLGEHGMWGKQALWDPTTRVPLIIAAPWMKQSSATRYAPFFEMIDLFNTVVDLAGLPPPLDVNDGTSAAHAFAPAALRRQSAAIQGKDAAFMQYPRCIKPTPSPPRFTDDAGINGNGSQAAPLWPPSLSEFDDHNPCTTGQQGQRTAFGWMGYSIRTIRWRYTVWLPWNGTSQTAEWEALPSVIPVVGTASAGAGVGSDVTATYQELYAHGTGVRNGTDWHSFDNEGVNLAAVRPLPSAHAQAIVALHGRLRAAVLSWNQR